MTKMVITNDEWTCPICNLAFDSQGFIDHLKAVHDIDAENAKGNRVILWTDGGITWETIQYAVIVNRLSFFNKVTWRISP